MIGRFYLKNYLSFEQIDLEFNKGLVVFTGASGAGKSVLMNSILALFGTTDTKANLSEITLEDLNLEEENYDIDIDDDIVIKQNTTSKTRYLLNNQTISKKNLKQFTSNFSKHLHLKDTSDFDSDKIITFLDLLCSKNDLQFKSLLTKFQENFEQYNTTKKKLDKIIQDEQDLDSLIEYTKFEIEKISNIDPKEDEFDELKSVKNNLSKKDKIEEILEDAKPFLNNTHKISSALNILDIDSSFFDDAINEVNSSFEKFYDSVTSMDDTDIEKVLTRIEDLSSLNKKYGGIKEALEYKKQKELELEGYENISFEKAILEKNVTKLYLELEELSKNISSKRKENLPILVDKINEYLKYLYLENLTININPKSLDSTGMDTIEFFLNNTTLSKISSGEFNRLRLALLTTRSIYEINTNGILFLDEIDANLSGKESQSIAKVLEQLSKNYQIFTISHQPQLSAIAHQHFLVKKENEISTVKLLNKEQRVDEIARMISGENITLEAIDFAKKLL
ncbi:MAG: AAA family ATPase [Campylobacterota bacterium]|nr:AAA family ATPase [Campylobacterota bacterium]